MKQTRVSLVKAKTSCVSSSGGTAPACKSPRLATENTAPVITLCGVCATRRVSPLLGRGEYGKRWTASQRAAPSSGRCVVMDLPQQLMDRGLWSAYLRRS